jgi:TetR/AcrR family transcriptional regulator
MSRLLVARRRSGRAGAPPRPARPDGRERRDPEGTRRALVAAATRLFAERGFDAVPIGAVAAEAGVNKALISYHFGGKRGLYREILVSTFAELAADLRAAEAKGRDASSTLRLLLGSFARVRERRPEFPLLFVREVLSHGVEPAALPHMVEILGVTQRVAVRGMREGAFRRVDPISMHFALFGSLIYYLATEPARRRAMASGRLPRMPDFAEFLRYLEELTLRGLRPDRTASPTRRKGARA